MISFGGFIESGLAVHTVIQLFISYNTVSD